MTNVIKVGYTILRALEIQKKIIIINSIFIIFINITVIIIIIIIIIIISSFINIIVLLLFTFGRFNSSNNRSKLTNQLEGLLEIYFLLITPNVRYKYTVLPIRMRLQKINEDSIELYSILCLQNICFAIVYWLYQTFAIFSWREYIRIIH